MKTVFVRPERCIGCRHCEMECAIEHATPKSLYQIIAEDNLSKPRITVGVTSTFQTFPNRCRHCDPAPCMQVCPTDALYLDEQTGSVLVHYGRCIRCAVCAMACPFGVITFHRVHEPGIRREVNAKCDNCISRLREGRIPACADACKTGALEFGELNDCIRNSSHDFTIRVMDSQGADTAVPVIPENVRAFRTIIREMAELQ